MKALILTGPRDGQLIDHHGQYLDLVDECASLEYLIRTYKRVVFYDGERYVDLFVPYKWPDEHMRSKVLGHLLRSAFERAV